jgi:hypothetical protein
MRFEAPESNACWPFDVSIADAHYLAEQRALPEAGQSGYPHLALFSVVDDHSRVNYQEYHDDRGHPARDLKPPGRLSPRQGAAPTASRGRLRYLRTF